MSDDEYCTLKDLIYGTRKLYIKNEKYLTVLRKLVYCYDKNIENLYFILIKGTNDKPELICRFIQNLKTLKSIINLIQIKALDHSSINGKCIKDKKGNYTISSYEYKAFIKSNNLTNFSNIIKEIEKSDFVNKINFGTYNDNKNILGIYPAGIYFKTKNFSFLYLAKDNSITINSKKKFKKDDIINLLNYQIPSYILSDFHKNLIISNKVNEKPIEFIEEIYKHKTYFNIEENEDKIILRKVNK